MESLGWARPFSAIAESSYNMTMVHDHGRIAMKIATVPAGEFKAKCLKHVAMNVNHQQCRIAQRGKDDNARAPRR